MRQWRLGITRSKDASGAAKRVAIRDRTRRSMMLEAIPTALPSAWVEVAGTGPGNEVLREHPRSLVWT